MPEPVDADLPSFMMPEYDAESTFGWGPSAVPSQYEGIPFAPFNRNDRLGRISDFSTNANRQGNNTRGRYPQQFGMGTGAFGYKHEDDEATFKEVDSRPKPKSRFGNRGRQQYKPQWQNNRGRWGNNRGGYQNGRGGWNNNKNNRGRGGWGAGRWGYNRDPIIKDASIHVTDDFTEVATFEFSDLERITAEPPTSAENMVETGSLLGYGGELDRCTPKNPKVLLNYKDRHYLTSTTSDDPVLMELAESEAGTVFGTDVILGCLMACTRAAASWDILVRKEGGVLYFDKRPESKLDMLTVNENQNEQNQTPVTDKDSINHPDRLSNEATDINRSFSQQVLNSELPVISYGPHRYGIEAGQTPASGAFRYRKLDFGQFVLVVRTQLSGYVKGPDGTEMLMACRALNEFDAKLSGNLDWRQKLETQSGTLLAGEMKNNGAKIARWMAEIALSGAQELRLGFVSRKDTKTAHKHEILLTKRYNPAAFGDQYQIKLGNLWAILRRVVAVCQKQEDGEYLILKNPNAPKLHLYACPAGDGDEENDDGEEE